MPVCAWGVSVCSGSLNGYVDFFVPVLISVIYGCFWMFGGEQDGRMMKPHGVGGGGLPHR